MSLLFNMDQISALSYELFTMDQDVNKIESEMRCLRKDNAAQADKIDELEREIASNYVKHLNANTYNQTRIKDLELKVAQLEEKDLRDVRIARKVNEDITLMRNEVSGWRRYAEELENKLKEKDEAEKKQRQLTCFECKRDMSETLWNDQVCFALGRCDECFYSTSTFLKSGAKISDKI
jgi:hypothetical protein